jgi:hypothetical protein
LIEPLLEIAIAFQNKELALHLLRQPEIFQCKDKLLKAFKWTMATKNEELIWLANKELFSSTKRSLALFDIPVLNQIKKIELSRTFKQFDLFGIEYIHITESRHDNPSHLETELHFIQQRINQKKWVFLQIYHPEITLKQFCTLIGHKQVVGVRFESHLTNWPAEEKKRLAEILANHPQLLYFDLYFFRAADQWPWILENGLSKNPRLLNLYVNGSNIDSTESDAIVDAIVSFRENPVMKNLYLSLNCSPDLPVQKLSTIVAKFPNLTQLQLLLDLRPSDTESVKYFFKTLLKLEQLKGFESHLILKFQDLFKQTLAEKTSFEQIAKLSLHHFGPVGFEKTNEIFNSFLKNNQLRSLTSQVPSNKSPLFLSHLLCIKDNSSLVKWKVYTEDKSRCLNLAIELCKTHPKIEKFSVAGFFKFRQFSQHPFQYLKKVKLHHYRLGYIKPKGSQSLFLSLINSPLLEIADLHIPVGSCVITQIAALIAKPTMIKVRFANLNSVKPYSKFSEKFTPLFVKALEENKNLRIIELPFHGGMPTHLKAISKTLAEHPALEEAYLPLPFGSMSESEQQECEIKVLKASRSLLYLKTTQNGLFPTFHQSQDLMRQKIEQNLSILERNPDFNLLQDESPSPLSQNLGIPDRSPLPH